MESEFLKIILTKDKTGKITNYELIANVTFKLESIKKIEFSEKKIMKNWMIILNKLNKKDLLNKSLQHQ